MVYSTRAKGKSRQDPIVVEQEDNSESTGLSPRAAEDLDEDSDEYLAFLLRKARESALAAAQEEEIESDEDVLQLDQAKTYEPLPTLDHGLDSSSYRPRSTTQPAGSSSSLPSAPEAPPELSSSGKALTKKEIQKMRPLTAGKDWFDMPAPPEADLPRLYQEVEALRLRNQLDPKRFYRRDPGESKGIKGLPKFFGIGRILPTKTPFGTASSDNAPKSHRKRTLVDELMADDEAKRYAKRKFNELQTVRTAKGKKTLSDKKLATRRTKW